MSNALSTLTDEDVRKIVQLVETLDRSTFDYLQLESGDLKVTLGKGNGPAAPAVALPAAAAPPVAAAAAPAAGVATAVPAPGAPAPAVRHEAAAADGTVAIEAPTMGRFYARPDPAAAPFVSVGTEVSADTTVALIEVMKVFTAIRAGVAGVITEICVQDAEFVGFGHVLFRVQPA